MNVGARNYRERMDSLPLTRSAPWTEIPAGMEPLFAELAPPGLRSVEVRVWVPEGGGRRCVMDVVASRAEAERAFGMAFKACESWDDFEVIARRFTG